MFLIAEDDHDGRVGSEEFVRAVNSLAAAAPEHLDFNPATSDLASLANTLKSKLPDAIVLWTGPEAAATLLSVLHEAAPSAVIYLGSKAAQFSPQSSQPWFSASLISPTAGALRILPCVTASRLGSSLLWAPGKFTMRCVFWPRQFAPRDQIVLGCATTLHPASPIPA